MFEPIELRKQCTNNRQSSSEVFDPEITVEGGYIWLSVLMRTTC
jgi:hypothetical protein